jgi:hypothetical protein
MHVFLVYRPTNYFKTVKFFIFYIVRGDTLEMTEMCNVICLFRFVTLHFRNHTGIIFYLSPSRRREAPCEGTNSPRLFTPGETKALAKSKVHQ